MKIKQGPSDFRVRELFDFERDPAGTHYVHLLRKVKLSTPEALDRIVRRCRVPRAAIAYAGLKDRQGITEQHISVEGRRLELEEGDLRLRFLGRSATKVRSEDSAGNAFRIVVRDLEERDLRRLERNLEVVEEFGLPNYFDDQRFGSLAQGQGLVFLDLCRGSPERALKALLATPGRRGGGSGRPPGPRGDRAGRRASSTPGGREAPGERIRGLLRKHWGDWEAILRFARGPMYQGVFGHLRANPGDFRGALAKVPLRTRTLHLFTFQSFLWNRAVSLYLAELLGGRPPVLPSLCGPLTFWGSRDALRASSLGGRSLPLPDARTRCPDRGFQKALEEVCARLGLGLKELDLGGMPGFELKEEPRALVLTPERLDVGKPRPDERNRGRLKLELSFTLPRGAYATLVVRRLFAGRAGASPVGRVR